jgi:hypothetical protein
MAGLTTYKYILYEMSTSMPKTSIQRSMKSQKLLEVRGPASVMTGDDLHCRTTSARRKFQAELQPALTGSWKRKDQSIQDVSVIEETWSHLSDVEVLGAIIEAM